MTDVYENMADRKRADYLQALIQKSEAKRVGENLTKRELTSIFNMHYNFYWNCVSKRDVPSEKLVASIEAYINTPTPKVYEMVFALRRRVEGSKRTTWDENGREVPNELLGLSSDDIDAYLKDLEADGIYKEPKLSYPW